MNGGDFGRFFENKHLLITGGAGYVATNVLQLLKGTECRVTRLDRPGASLLPLNEIPEVKDLAGDVCSRLLWEEALNGIDVVLHFAAQTSVYKANENPTADLEVNFLPMMHLLETCRLKGWRPIVLFASTVTIAGIPQALPVNETHPDNPITVYDLHKLMAENYLEYYARQGFVRGAILRLANVYGPGPKSSSADRGVLNLMMRKALKGEPLSIYGQGDYVRDYVYVEDVALAFLEACANVDRVNAQHFVIGSGKGYTLLEAFNLVADRVALKTGQRVPIRHIESPTVQSAIETRNFVADSSKFCRATGWKAKYPLSEGIDRTLASFLQP
jgi:UDP-glucose 4-epimerase